MATLQQWDSSAAWYDQNMGESGDILNSQIIKPTLFRLLGNLKGKEVLDAGCGSGYVASELAKTAKKVIGFDFSENFISLCQKKYRGIKNLEFQVQDVTRPMSFFDNQFDVVVSKMVLQYVPQIAVFAQESRRILKANGRIIVIVDHPFHSQYFYAQAQAGKLNPKYSGLKNYYSTDPQNKLSLWGKVNLTWYPRTVGAYVNTFLEAKLSLTKMEELSEEKEKVQLPRILILVWGKNSLNLG